MDTVHATLRRIRNWFVVWFVIESAIGITVAVAVLEELSHYRFLHLALGDVSAPVTAATGVLGAAVVLALALLAFAALLELRPWARLVLLVVGWVTVVGGALSLVSMPVTISLLDAAGVPGVDGWIASAVLTFLPKVIDLVFWGYVIAVLQFNDEVRQAFVCHRPAVSHGGGVRGV